MPHPGKADYLLFDYFKVHLSKTKVKYLNKCLISHLFPCMILFLKFYSFYIISYNNLLSLSSCIYDQDNII